MKPKTMPQCQICLSAGTVLVLLQEIFCGSTVVAGLCCQGSKYWSLLRVKRLIFIFFFFLYTKLVERPFSANLMSMAITCMPTDVTCG